MTYYFDKNIFNGLLSLFKIIYDTLGKFNDDSKCSAYNFSMLIDNFTSVI